MILVIDQGTTSTRSIVFGLDAAPVASAQAEFQQLYPRPGWVEHDPETLWRTTLSTAREALRRAGLRGERPGGDRDRQPARDRADLGARDGQADRQRDRVAGPPHGRGLRWPEGGRRGAAGDGGDRPCDRPLFFGHQDRLAPRPCRGRAGGGRARRARLRHRRYVPCLAPDERRRPRDRRHQRLAHAALRHPQRRLGRRHAAALPRAARAPARSQGHGGRVWRERARTPGRFGPDPGARRRSAERADRPGLRSARHGQGDLRHRRVPPAQHRRDARAVAQSPADHRRLPVARQADLCARGLDLLGRGDGAMAARRPRDHRLCAGSRRARRARRLDRAASISRPPSPASARPIGARTRARSSAG